MKCMLIETKGRGRYRRARSFRDPGMAARALTEALEALLPGGSVVFEVRSDYAPEEVSRGIYY